MTEANVEAASASITVQVPLGDRSYSVIVGNGVRDQVNALIAPAVRRVAIVTQENIPFAIQPQCDSQTFVIGHGEHHKSLATIETLCRSFAKMGLTRNDLVIGVGGGMVTDVAGFAAASWHRGVPVVHVSTTLLGMIDAAVGGKTGVNLPEGKNLVGAFWQPSGVLCDLDYLSSLPPREMRCGLGEMAKYHFLTGDNLLQMDLTQRVARCVQIKGDIVADDEREGGRRALLNYGHTLAHALEIATEFSLAHGEAVAIGLVYAAHLAAALDRIDEDRVAEHYRVVATEYGLITSLPAFDHTDLVNLMARDKKALNGLTFILDGENGVEVVDQVPFAAAAAALERMTSWEIGHV